MYKSYRIEVGRTGSTVASTIYATPIQRFVKSLLAV